MQEFYKTPANSRTSLDLTFMPPQVSITMEAYQMVMAYVSACPVEINGLGTVERVGNDFTITDVFILEQVVTGVSAETDDGALHRFIAGLIKNGDDPNKVRLQWHSHVTMDAYCSGVDLGTIERYANDFMISLVLNKHGNHHCRLDVFKPFRVGFTCELNLLLPQTPDEVREAAREEVGRKVRREGMFRKRPVKPNAAIDEELEWDLDSLEEAEI